MENASKALIMAGGILIGILILSLFVYEMTNMSTTAKAYEEEMARTKVLEFNSRFEAYAYDSDGDNQTVRKLKAQEIATLYNYIIEWNYGGELNEGHPSDIISVTFQGDSAPGLQAISTYSIKEQDIDKPKKKLPIEEFLNGYIESEYYFTIVDMKYTKPEGRINLLTIKCIKK